MKEAGRRATVVGGGLLLVAANILMGGAAGGAEGKANPEAGKKIYLESCPQFIQESSNLSELTGGRVRYRLISLNPVNKQNAPRSGFERKALEAVMAHPEQPFKGEVAEGGARYFQALYADPAVSAVCVSCHNADPRSSKQDYKLRDVLGAVLISIPMPE